MRLVRCAAVICLALPASASAADPRVSVKVVSKGPVEQVLRAKVRVVGVRKPATVRFWLSRNATLERKRDTRLRGSARVPARGARAARSGSASVTLRVPARTVAGTYRLLGCVGATCATSPGKLKVLATSPPGALGGVRYTDRDCYGKGVGAPAPAAFATVRFTHPGEPTQLIALDANGRFTRVPPVDTNVPFTAELVLTGDEVEVGPDAAPFEPYAIKLGPLRSKDQIFVIGGGAQSTTPDAGSGAANIFTELERAARTAKPLVPVAMPKLRVTWRYGRDLKTWLGDVEGTAYGTVEDRIYVGGSAAGVNRAEWEPTVLLHELGHRVMRYVAEPSGNANDPDHGYHTVHEAKPALAWSEGFAHAFGAIISGSPRQNLGCEPALDLQTWPATAKIGAPGSPLVPAPSGAPFTPLSQDFWSSGSATAQDNETAVAGALWLLTSRLGGGTVAHGDVASARLGLARLLDAMKAHHAAYGGPEDARAARDAVLEFEETTDAEHELFNSAFELNGFTGWSYWIDADWTQNGGTCVVETGPGSPPEPGACHDPHVQISMSGPGGFSCVARVDEGAAVTFVPPDEGDRGFTGPVAHTWRDECWTSSQGSLALQYPVLPGQAHRKGLYTVRLKTHCESHPAQDPNTGATYGECPNTFKVRTTFSTRGESDVRAEGYGNYVVDREVPMNTTVEIAEFTADGRTCRLAPTGRACDL